MNLENTRGIEGCSSSLQLLQVQHTAHPVMQDQQALSSACLAPVVEASSPDGARLALKIQKRHDEEAGVTGPSIGREQVKYAISARYSGAQHSPAQSGPVTGGPKLEEERTGRLPAHTPAPRAPPARNELP
jgi:hypothetical protein